MLTTNTYVTLADHPYSSYHYFGYCLHYVYSTFPMLIFKNKWNNEYLHVRNYVYVFWIFCYFRYIDLRERSFIGFKKGNSDKTTEAKLACQVSMGQIIVMTTTKQNEIKLNRCNCKFSFKKK